jgi:hypothetical protein
MSDEPPRWLLVAVFLGVCGLADLSPLAKLHPPSVVVEALAGVTEGGRAQALYWLLVAITLGMPVLAVGWVARRRGSPEGGRALVVSVALVAAMFAVARVMEPRAAALHALGRGSDQQDCIVMPAHALVSGRWPYDRALIWSGNACSPGLGWIALATPFVLAAGYPSFLVAGAAALVLLPARRMERRTATAFLVLLLSCVTAWQSLATGADDLAIGIGLALVTALLDERRLTVVVGVALGLLATARLPFAFLPIALAALLYRAGEHKRAALLGAVGLGTLAVAHGVPLALNARSYVEDGPFHVLGKAARIEAEGGGAAIFVSCAIAWIAFAVWALRRKGAGAASPVARQFDLATLTLLCVAAPALADLAARLGTEEGLEGWQGGNWLLAALPSYAASLAIALSDRARVASPPADTSSLPAR